MGGVRSRRPAALLLAPAVAALVAGCSGGGAGHDPYISPGKRAAAPALSGSDLNGGHVDLAIEAKDKVAVVNFWASWCAPCRAESGALRAVADATPSVAFVGVDEDHTSKANARSFATEHRLPYPSVWDSQSAIAGGWNVPGLPQTFVVDRTGKVAARFTGAVTQGELSDMLKRVQAEHG